MKISCVEGLMRIFVVLFSMLHPLTSMPTDATVSTVTTGTCEKQSNKIISTFFYIHTKLWKCLEKRILIRVTEASSSAFSMKLALALPEMGRICGMALVYSLQSKEQHCFH